MIRNILKNIFRKKRKITTDEQKEKLDADSISTGKKILKEEEEKLRNVKDQLNKNLGDLFNNNVFF